MEGDRLHAIFGNLESISSNFAQNNKKITAIMTNIETVSDQFAKANFEKTIKNADKAVADLQMAIDKVNTGQGSLGQLINDKQLYNNLNSSAENLNKLMIDLKANPKRYVSFSVFGGRKD
jgi:phospholipid/cholesterol/gamma-HCH transport system substrate-binding protein